MVNSEQWRLAAALHEDVLVMEGQWPAPGMAAIGHG